jgi:pyrroline-5-carboxylate reductase
LTIGLIGAGNMARALARGWGEPVLATDGGSGRAATLVEELGGEALASNAELAGKADVIVLAVKPYQLEAIGPEIAGEGRRVLSVLGGTTVDQLRAALPGATVVRCMPTTPVEVRRGVTALAEESDPDEEIHALLERVGVVVTLPERLMDVAAATSGVSPAYIAVVAEAMVDAAVKRGLTPPVATQLVVETIAGSAALLAARDGDTLAVRREVASPGGTTARGLAALEQAGLRSAFLQAIDAALGS